MAALVCVQRNVPGEGKGRERAAGGDGLHDDDATRPWGQRTEGSLATVGPDGGEEERGGAHAHRPAGFLVGAAACSAVGVERARAQAAHLVGLRTGLGSVSSSKPLAGAGELAAAAGG